MTSPCSWSSCHWAELAGRLDHGLGPVEPPGGERRPQPVVERGGRQQQLGEHGRVLQGLRGALGQGRRAGVGGVADQHDPAPVPRGGHEQGLKKRVADRGRVGQRRPDVVPRPVVGGGELAHGREPLRRRLPGAVPCVLHQVCVQRVLAGGAVPGDVRGPAVVQVGPGHAGRPGPERAEDAHARRPGLVGDPDHPPGRRPDTVRPDDEVVAPGRAVREGDVHAVAVLRQRARGGAQPQLGARRDRAIDHDPRQRGPWQADRGRQVGSAGPRVGKIGKQRARRVGSAQARAVERVARGQHCLPDAQAAQFPQAVALHGDARARDGNLRLDVDQVDRHPGGGQADGGRGAGQAGPAISTRLTAGVTARLPTTYLRVSSPHYQPGKRILEIDC